MRRCASAHERHSPAHAQGHQSSPSCSQLPCNWHPGQCEPNSRKLRALESAARCGPSSGPRCEWRRSDHPQLAQPARMQGNSRLVSQNPASSSPVPAPRSRLCSTKWKPTLVQSTRVLFCLTIPQHRAVSELQSLLTAPHTERARR